jgi:23S rRNA (cytidine2498-2'-O)-methyltransferase
MPHRILFSAASGYFDAARAELASAFGGVAIERLGPDAGLATVDGTLPMVSRAAQELPFVFIRHLTEEVARLSAAATATEIARALLDQLLALGPPRPIALQAWTSLPPAGEVRIDELRRAVVAPLTEAGFTVARSGRHEVAAICMTSRGLVVARAPATATLSDWPAGRVRLSRSPEQISRAEFKLEEAIATFSLDLSAGATALDLGASPGGWTRILRQHGLEVWAVDPGELAPALIADEGVHHVATTAGRFLSESNRRFDVVVNDMRMDPILSTKMMLDAAPRVAPGGLIVMTLKLTPRNAYKTAHRAISALRGKYEVSHARQLHHNRNEATVAAYRLTAGS